MPKIIEHLPERLAEEARRQILESGYAALTVRSVAKACGVGVGTVYNYYPSKDALVAAYMLVDWKTCVETIASAGETATESEPVLRAIHEALTAFIREHNHIFRDEAAMAGFAGGLNRYHSVLRSQISAPLRQFSQDDFTADFAAEAMLTWTVEGRSIDELLQILRRII